MNPLAIALASIEGTDEPADLLAAARTGDRAAFDLLMRRHERLVLMTALRLLGNMADAQDASQEVFLKLYRGLGQVTSENLPGWLYRVTVNACHDLHRRRGADPITPAAESPDDPQRELLDAERRQALQGGLRVLSEREREALVLRDLEGLTTAEVAEILGTSQATVRSHIWKARIKVKDFVERRLRRRT